MDIDLNIEVLEKVLGFKHVFDDDVPARHGGLREGKRQEAWVGKSNGYYCKWCGNIPDFSSDLNAAHEVEEKIKEMGLTWSYVSELVKKFGTTEEPNPSEIFELIHASAEDRCKAALAAVEGKR